MLPKYLRIIHLFSDLEFETAFGLDLNAPIPTPTTTPITGKGHCPGKFQLQFRPKNIFKVLKYVVSFLLIQFMFLKTKGRFLKDKPHFSPHFLPLTLVKFFTWSSQYLLTDHQKTVSAVALFISYYGISYCETPLTVVTGMNISLEKWKVSIQ